VWGGYGGCIGLVCGFVFWITLGRIAVFFISVCWNVTGYSVVPIAGVCVGCVVDLRC